MTTTPGEVLKDLLSLPGKLMDAVNGGPVILTTPAILLKLGNVIAQVAEKSIKPDLIVSPKGTAMPTNKDFNLVDSKKPGAWFQIHNTHTDAKAPGISHTHFPERHHQSTTREIRTTSGSDIDKADGLLRSGQMRERLNRGDRGGPLP